MSGKNPFDVVTSKGLPEYQLAKDDRLEAHWFFPWHHNRWLNSAFRLKATPEVGWFGMNLFSIAQNQAPVGTLPDDDQQLAALLNIDLAHWQDLRRRSISPLYNWSRCDCDGEIRLMHPVVTEVVLESLRRKKIHQQALAAGRANKRRQRVVAQIAKIGTARMAEDKDVVSFVLEWLSSNEVNRWSEDHIRTALEAHSAGQLMK